jgi:hypothetical protein
VAGDLDNTSHLAAMRVGPENPSAINDTVNEIHIMHITAIHKHSTALKKIGIKAELLNK